MTERKLKDDPSQPQMTTQVSSGKESPKRGIESHIGAIVLIALVLITLVNVVVRYFTDQSFAWTEEISVFLLLALTLAGSAIAAARDGHIRIEFFYERASPPVRRLLIWLSTLCTLAMFLLLTVLMMRAGWQEFIFEETTTGLGIPRWWYTVWLPPLALYVVARTWISGRRQLKIMQEAPSNEVRS